MATSQNTTCARPSFAAIPTQEDPTTQSTCARTRSRRPSSLRREAESSLTVQQSCHNTEHGLAQLDNSVKERHSELPRQIVDGHPDGKDYRRLLGGVETQVQRP